MLADYRNRKFTKNELVCKYIPAILLKSLVSIIILLDNFLEIYFADHL